MNMKKKRKSKLIKIKFLSFKLECIKPSKRVVAIISKVLSILRIVIFVLKILKFYYFYYSENQSKEKNNHAFFFHLKISIEKKSSIFVYNDIPKSNILPKPERTIFAQHFFWRDPKK